MKQRFNNYLSPSLTSTGKLRKMKKQKYLCKDGPLIGEKLSLTEPETMIITINGQKGRYMRVNNQGRLLEWQVCK